MGTTHKQGTKSTIFFNFLKSLFKMPTNVDVEENNNKKQVNGGEYLAQHREKVKKMSAAQKQKYLAGVKSKGEKRRKAVQGDLIFPVNSTRRRLRKSMHNKKITLDAAIFAAASIEYLVAELIELGGECATQHKKKRIIPRHLLMAIQNDDEFAK